MVDIHFILQVAPACSTTSGSKNDSCGSHPKIPRTEELPSLFCIEDRSTIQIGERLGGGEYGTVYKASLEGTCWPASYLGREVVVKVFKADSVGGRGSRTLSAQILNEVVLGCNKHRSLVQCLGFTQSPPFWALFEECNRGSLEDALRAPSMQGGAPRLIDVVREQGLSLVVDLVDGMAHLHEKGLLHCDLHGGNVLLHEVCGKLSIRIADFGQSSRILDRKYAEPVRFRDRDRFSERYPQVAPESVAGVQHGELYTTATDMWSVGYVVQQVLGLDRETSAPRKGVCKVHLSERAQSLVHYCTHPRGKDRPSAKELLAIFKLELDL